jgi:5-methylthioadenosine/S-adenosylhomocysteine deaminase
MPSSEASRTECDLLIRGGTVITLDAVDQVLPRGAIAIDGGSILAVGESDEIENQFAPREILSADDAILLPGLVNSHNHTPLTLVRGMIEDLNFAPSYSAGVPGVHDLSFDDTLALARLGCYELLRGGATTVVDYYRHPNALAQAVEEIGVRAVIGGRIHDADTEALARGTYEHKTAIGVATLRETADLIAKYPNRSNSRIRVDYAPHAPDTCSPALLAEVAAAAGSHGGNIHTHLAQSQGEVAYVRQRDGHAPHETLAEAGLLDSRLIAAHCVFLDTADVAAVGRAGITVAHAPHQNLMAGNIAPIRDLEAAGSRIVLCTDTRSSDLFEAMRLAIGSARVRRREFEPKAPRVIRWATTEAAAALGMADRIGSIEAGKKADMILLDRREPNLTPMVDGYGIVVYSGHALNVSTVVVDGRILIRDGRPVAFDGDGIVRDARVVATRLWGNH